MGILFVSCLLHGCTAQAPRAAAQAAVEAGAAEAQHYWWYVRYRMTWPDGAEPDWRVDLLLADAVIKPVFNTYRQQIRFWRFHRRANRDEAGHQFSFIFYADRDTAGSIYAALSENKLAQKLQETNVIRKVVTDNPVKNHLSGVQDTSDKKWPETLQTAWPAYIMGVSDMWLILIEQNLDKFSPDAGVDDLLAFYGVANDRITALWKNEGRHALLHHLNAIFGYEPINLDKPVQF